MGNPAMVKRKKSEKRRKKYEQRLGPGAYLPKGLVEPVHDWNLREKRRARGQADIYKHDLKMPDEAVTIEYGRATKEIDMSIAAARTIFSIE